MIVGTVGHIDHGKTSLVKALTGIDTDRLKEEKRRGISVDLGFAYQTLACGQRIGFVDMPGHEKLIHTMLAGSGSIDYVLLVIAADDGIMPQTREHMEILQLLGIKQGLIAVTRCDLVNKEQLDNVLTQITQFVAGSFLQDSPIFAVSTLTGLGLEPLKKKLYNEAQSCPPRPCGGRLRHAIDRCFTLTGVGTVVTGSMLSGTVHVHDDVLIAPQNIKARVRSLHVQDEEADAAQAGDRAALNLSGSLVTKDSIKRGDMVIDPFLNAPTQRFDAQVSCLSSEKKPLNQWFPTRLHHASQDMAARLVFLEHDRLAPGQTAFVQVITDKPLIAINGDHFVLRDTSASRTIGGGRIIAPHTQSRRRRSQEHHQWLNAMAKHDHQQALDALLALPPYTWNWSQFMQARNLDDKMAQDLLQKPGIVLFSSGQEQTVMAQNAFNKLRAEIIAYLENFHHKEPDLFGVGLEKLRRELASAIKAPIFRTVLQHDIDSGLLKLRNAWIGLTRHEAKLSDNDEKTWQQILPVLLGENRFKPPRTRDFAHQLNQNEEAVRKILKSLARMGQLYEVAQDYFFPRAVLAEIVQIMQDIARHHAKGDFVAADLRDRLNNGRKIAILMLEFFDRHGLTIRKGDVRRLNPHRINLFDEN